MNYIKKYKPLILVVAVFIVCYSIAYYVSAGTFFDAPGVPTGCPADYPGCDAPINVGTTPQTKIGSLQTNNDFTVLGTSWLSTVRAYGNIGVYNSLGNVRGYPGYISAADNGMAYYYNNTGALKILLDSAGSSYFNGGNVGIGTTTPKATLQISGSNDNPIRIQQLDADAETWSYIEWYGTSTRNYWVGIDGQGRFRINPDPGSGLVMNRSGQVAIRYSIPGASLDVTGMGLTVNDHAFIIRDSAWAPKFYIKSNGWMSSSGVVGAAVPAYRIDVKGAAGADSQINAQGGLCINGDCKLNWAAVGGALPAGVAGQTLRHDGANWLASSLIYNNGTNVGIGVVAPSAKLEIQAPTNGYAFNILAPVAFGNQQSGIHISLKDYDADDVLMLLENTGGFSFRVDGKGKVRIIDGTQAAGRVLTSDIAGVASWQVPSSGTGTVGPGTINRVAKFTNATTVSDSIITDNGTNLSLTSAVGGYGAGRIQVNSLNDIIGLTLNSTSRTWDLISIVSTPVDYFAIRDNTAGVNRLTITDSGNVELTGQIKIAGGTPGAGKVLTSDAVGLASWQAGGGSVGPGTQNYISKFNVAGTNIGNSQIFDNSTNVGIGTTTPVMKLEVAGGPIKATGGLIMETRTTNPAAPTVGQIWMCTDAGFDCE